MRAYVAGALVVSVGSAAVHAQITDLGVLPGGTGSFATAISADGNTVVGNADSPLGGRAFRWTVGGGMQDLGELSSEHYARAAGVSSDGSVVTGYAQVGASPHGFRWTAATGMQDIGLLPGGNYSYPAGINANGSVIVGYAMAGNPARDVAFRWTASGGYQDLGTLYGLHTTATGVDGSGNVVVGRGQLQQGNLVTNRAYRWTAQTGMVDLGVMEANGEAWPHAVSSTGATVVGWASYSGQTRAFHWTQSMGMRIIGPDTGNASSTAFATNAGGSVVVGAMTEGLGVAAAYWTPSLGMVNLNQYLPSIGIAMDGWHLDEARSVDFTGRRIVGYGTHDGQFRAYLLQIPVPASSIPLAVALWRVRRRERDADR
jgi:probable HAF family extracellular repeat protein